MNDEVFSHGIMGEGIAVIPDTGDIYAPCDAIVTGVAESLHAVTLRTPDGINILLHVGINTVELQGKPFRLFCKDGWRLLEGDTIMRADIDAIRDAGYDPCVIMVLPDNEKLHVSCVYSDHVTKESTVIKIKK